MKKCSMQKKIEKLTRKMTEDSDKVVPDENDFEKCPYCGSHNTDIDYQVDLWAPADVLAYATCKDCGKEYHGQFIFTGAYYGKDGHEWDPIGTCPFCGSKEHTETVQFDGGGYVDQDFQCKSCGKTWYNSFVWSDTQSAFSESHKHCKCSMQKKTESLKITEAARKYYNTEDWWKRLQDDYNDMYDGLGFEFKFNGPEKMVDIYSNGKKWGSISWKGLYKLLDEDGKWLYKSPAPEFRDFLYYLAKYQGEDLNNHYNGTIAKRSW